MNETEIGRYAILVQRHLEMETRLADALDEMNQASAKIFVDAGVRGPTQQDLVALEPMMTDLQKLAKSVADARRQLLLRINREQKTEFTQIKHFIRGLPEPHRSRLNAARRSLLKRSSAAQSRLIHNQAVLFYTFDFHRKYLAGVLQTDHESSSYGADGQSSTANRGNLLGKSC